MIWIFIKNLLRSAATAVVTALIAGFLTGVILIVWDLLVPLLNELAGFFHKGAWAKEMNLALLLKHSGTDDISFYDFLPLILPAVTVSQICYAIAIWKHYASWQICGKCKRMFCIAYNYNGSRAWSETKYKTKTEKEKVGALYAGDQKVADVEGNVTREYASTTHYLQEYYQGICARCGEEQNNSTMG